MVEQVYNRTEQIKEVNVSTRYKPGHSGNPDGRPKNSVTTLLKNKSDKDNQELADVLWELALKGDMPAIREVLDRKEGKVDSTLNIKGDMPVSITFIRESTTEPPKQLEE